MSQINEQNGGLMYDYATFKKQSIEKTTRLFHTMYNDDVATVKPFQSFKNTLRDKINYSEVL